MDKISIKISIEQDLEDLIPGYLANKKEDIERMDSFLSAWDFRNIAFLAHRMKGTGGSYGFNRISEIGAAIKKSATDRDIKGIAFLLDQLKDFLKRLEIIYI